ncbi:MAG TPA: tetratricopeptide repeat protein [Bacteroidia bacterium]|jgi:tetratricopeptide (TPR) repeat protein|nr:tetratricopeptide repeat protein [Bacteroidia bacterium]
MSCIKIIASVLCLVVVSLTIVSCNQKEESKEVTLVTEVEKSKTTELPPPPPKTEVPSQEELQNQIKEMEKVLYASEVLDVNKAKQMIRLYDLYHKNYYKDNICPEYLLKAGEISENISQYNRAADFYRMCCTEYNDNFKLRGECLFRLANMYDYKLNDYIRAKQTYKQVIEQYPKTQLAKDAEAAIKMMGKSDADMIREFERKNAAKK